jgi:hypothetical protein
MRNQTQMLKVLHLFDFVLHKNVLEGISREDDTHKNNNCR